MFAFLEWLLALAAGARSHFYIMKMHLRPRPRWRHSNSNLAKSVGFLNNITRKRRINVLTTKLCPCLLAGFSSWRRRSSARLWWAGSCEHRPPGGPLKAYLERGRMSSYGIQGSAFVIGVLWRPSRCVSWMFFYQNITVNRTIEAGYPPGSRPLKDLPARWFDRVILSLESVSCRREGLWHSVSDGVSFLIGGCILTER